MSGTDQGAHGRSTGPRELTITHRGNDLLMATSEHVCIAVWETKPTRDLFEIQKAHLAAAVAREPGRALFLCIVSKGAAPPDQEVRDASSKMVASHGQRLAGCALVIEGTGFRAAITRTVLTGIMIVTRAPVPITFHDSVAAGCRWLEARAGGERIRGLTEKIERARVAMPR